MSTRVKEDGGMFFWLGEPNSLRSDTESHPSGNNFSALGLKARNPRPTAIVTLSILSSLPLSMFTVSQPPPLPGFGLPLGLPPRGRTVVLRGDNGEKVEIIKVRGEPLFHTVLYHDIMNWQNKR